VLTPVFASYPLKSIRVLSIRKDSLVEGDIHRRRTGFRSSEEFSHRALVFLLGYKEPTGRRVLPWKLTRLHAAGEIAVLAPVSDVKCANPRLGGSVPRFSSPN